MNSVSCPLSSASLARAKQASDEKQLEDDCLRENDHWAASLYEVGDYPCRQA